MEQLGKAGIRVGVIGCGYWGEKHVRVLTQMPEVGSVVAVDSRPEIRTRISTNHPSVITHPDLGAALDDLDAVLIATPPESHADLATQAMEAGKHALVEKPMTRTSAEGRQLVALARAKGVTLAVGHTFMHNAAVTMLVDIVRAGDLGKIHHMDAARLSLGLYRRDVNVIWDLAAHDVSITHAVLGRVPDEVSCWAMRHTESYTEDVANLRLLYEAENIESTIRVSWLDPMKVRRTTVVGADRMAVYDDLAADERIKILDRGREQQGKASAVAYRYGDMVTPFIHFPEPLRAQAEDFVNACLTGVRPRCTGDDGLAVVRVLEATEVSLAENGIAVPVERASGHREVAV